MIRVAFCDDSPEMRVALRLLLSLSKNIEIVCEVNNGQEAIDCVKRFQPDVLAMDIRMPVMNGLDATREIVDLALQTRVILISTDIGSHVARKAAAYGAQGFVPKDDVAELLVQAIETVHGGEPFFVE
jgi:DNA-binding NarL/FixJ family response regulator